MNLTAAESKLPAPATVSSVQKSETSIHQWMFQSGKPITLRAFGDGQQQGGVLVLGQDPKNVLVQRKDGSRWVTVARVGKNASSSPGAVSFVEPNAPSTIRGIRQKAGSSGHYRLFLPATDATKEFSTPARTIIWSAPLKHSASLPFGSALTVSISKAGAIDGQVVLPGTAVAPVLEKKVGSKWVLAAKLQSWPKNGKFIAAVKQPEIKPGQSVQYRVRIPQTAQYAEYISPVQTVKRAKLKTEPTIYTAGTSVPIPSGDHASFTAGWLGGARPVMLQQKKKGQWVTIKTSHSSAGGAYMVNTPKTNKTGSNTFRLHIPATGSHQALTSKSAIVRTENPRHYTGYKKKIYGHVRKWCPNITIGTAAPNASYAGMADMLGRRITLVTGMSGNRLKHVALHECAHVLTQEAFRKNGKHQQMYDRLPKIYGGNWSRALEHAADCMARKMGSKGPFSYTNQCKGQRMSAAKKMIAGRIP